MKKWLPLELAVILMLLINKSGLAQEATLLRHRSYLSYSSASGIAWHRGRLYVMGDDAPDLLITGKKLEELKRIKVFESKEKRIVPSRKADLESAFLWKQNWRKYLVFLPSFSTPERRNMVVLPLASQQPKVQPTSLGNHRLQQPNIEGATKMRKALLLANRSLINVSSHDLLLYQFDVKNGLGKELSHVQLILPQGKEYLGISGLTYLRKKDILLLTFSTEATASATADGAIGDSFLGFVYNAKKQLKTGMLAVTALINLTPVLKMGQPQKIESLAIESVKKGKVVLCLAADNDDGSTELFVISVVLPREPATP